MQTIERPLEGEYAPYTIAYIGLVPDENILQHLSNNVKASRKQVESLSDEKLSTPCAEGEWTIKEILMHVIDTERIFAYRALRIGRGDTTSLPGFEQNDYVPTSQANQRTIEDILEEFEAVRTASISLFKNLPEEAYTRTALCSNNKTSVRALVYQIVGHELHHYKSIEENYLS